uniref:Uncharacterized protein n=1 Tax=Vitrella brassicaformis TaxID=1169539 RepID=A0A7S1KIK2_9ALVE|mmetsp:Transcript_684/g.1435  ORF Transcript_684/g.1435 Transcript_684/m.1435 type:complete len:294 (+) Transcript_684:188-1069(+)
MLHCPLQPGRDDCPAGHLRACGDAIKKIASRVDEVRLSCGGMPVHSSPCGGMLIFDTARKLEISCYDSAERTMESIPLWLTERTEGAGNRHLPSVTSLECSLASLSTGLPASSNPLSSLVGSLSSLKQVTLEVRRLGDLAKCLSYVSVDALDWVRVPSWYLDDNLSPLSAHTPGRWRFPSIDRFFLFIDEEDEDTDLDYDGIHVSIACVRSCIDLIFLVRPQHVEMRVFVPFDEFDDTDKQRGLRLLAVECIQKASQHYYTVRVTYDVFPEPTNGMAAGDPPACGLFLKLKAK